MKASTSSSACSSRLQPQVELETKRPKRRRLSAAKTQRHIPGHCCCYDILRSIRRGSVVCANLGCRERTHAPSRVHNSEVKRRASLPGVDGHGHRSLPKTSLSPPQHLPPQLLMSALRCSCPVSDIDHTAVKLKMNWRICKAVTAVLANTPRGRTTQKCICTTISCQYLTSGIS